MGEMKNGKCKQCHHKFEFATIGGFTFAIVRCTQCDEAKSVSWEEHKKSNEHGKCKCGGMFTNDAVVRCPKCKSDNIKDLGTYLMFD